METKKKMSKEVSIALHQQRKEKRERDRERAEKNREKLRLLKEKQKKQKEKEKEEKKYGPVPEGLNKATWLALHEEEPKEEKPKEKEPEEEEEIKPKIPPNKIVCPSSPERLRKKRRRALKEKIRGDLRLRWDDARHSLMKQREEECLDAIRLLPHTLSAEERDQRLLVEFKRIHEECNKKYRAAIAAINKDQKEGLLNYYKVNGQGPLLNLPPWVPQQKDINIYMGRT